MKARRGFLARAGQALFLVGLSVFVASAASAADELEPVRAVLRRHAGADERGPAELVAGLAALGPGAVPALYELVTGRGLDGLVGEEWRPPDWRCTPEEIPELCAQALACAPGKAVLEHIARVLAGEPTFQERIVVLRILTSQGSADGLALVLHSAAQLGELELLRPTVRRTLREALSTTLIRDERALAFFTEKALDELEPITSEILVEAVGAAERPRGMALLARLLVRGHLAPERIAEAMAQLERARPWDLAGQTLVHCSSWLQGPDPARRACAARLAGDLHALETVPTLIELAGEAEHEASVRRCAAGALQAMAGLPPGFEAAAFESAYEREESWRDAHWAELCRRLVADPPGPANAALQELGQHPLYRHEAARVLADTLLEQPRSVALATCRELERIGSRWAVPGLVATLENAPPQVRAGAWRALKKLTGAEQELSAEHWRALIRP